MDIPPLTKPDPKDTSQDIQSSNDQDHLLQAEIASTAPLNGNIQTKDDPTNVLRNSLHQMDIHPPTAKKSNRHGARNQHRHKIICKWLLERFPLPENSIILDVAGGKGEVASRLTMCHHLNVIMVDPRPADIASVYVKTVVTKLPKKWQQRIYSQLDADPDYVNKLVQQRFTQYTMYFDDTTVETQLQNVIQSCSLMIGIHADGATEAIVQAALQYSKPFVVIPCCVFPNFFTRRFIQDDQGRDVEVRSHEQFCQFLLELDCRFQTEVLPFEGRNVAIWWGGT